MTHYILNVAVIIAGCFLFYKLLLQKETFYKINRYVLLACLAIAFALPLVPVPQQLSFRKSEEVIIKYVPQVSTTEQQASIGNGQSAISNGEPATKQTTSKAATTNETSVFSIDKALSWLMYLYWFGVAAFGLNFLVQIAALLYRAYKSPVILDGKYRIVEVSGDKAPCSFGNSIFINPEKYEWETYSQILQHEKIHVRQRHSMDLLIAEIVLVFQWFNPFAWLYRKEIENNLEFLTDNQLVQHEQVEKESYQMSLLKVSVPQLALSLTTNYNQSLLKKRIAMMNVRKSNLHTVWKYFFLLPLLILFVSVLNKPLARTQVAKKEQQDSKLNATGKHELETEGSWFATIKNDKISFQFKSDDEENSYNNSSFNLSEFPNLPKGTSGTFKLTRDAGTVEFTGKFEGDQGMGKYKFVSNKQYVSDMNKELKENLSERDAMVFFFVDIKQGYVKMIKGEGYKEVGKDDVIPLAALKVDQAYIRSMKESGFTSVKLSDLIPLKSLGIDKNYVKEIRDAGFKDVSADQLISFKAQKIDGEYISKVKKASAAEGNKDKEIDANDIVSLKALDIDDNYINSFKEVGYSNLKRSDYVPMKSLGVTPEFVKGFLAMGYKDIEPNDIIALKAQNVNAEYIKTFEAIGYKKIKLQDLIVIKSLDVTPEFIKNFQDIGYKELDISDIIPLKAQHISPSFIKGFNDLGFKEIPINDVISLKAVGVTPEYVKDMKAKGLNYSRLDKYITLKSID